jgi:hypothetical protein
MRHKPPFLIDYNHKGRTYSFTIWGDSWSDAEQHLKSIASNGEIVGSDVEEYRVNSVSLPIVALWVRIRAWWLRRNSA